MPADVRRLAEHVARAQRLHHRAVRIPTVLAADLLEELQWRRDQDRHRTVAAALTPRRPTKNSGGPDAPTASGSRGRQASGRQSQTSNTRST